MNRRAVLFVVYVCGLCAVFGATLRDLLGHALGGPLYSHMLLIVPIVLYLLYAGRAKTCREYGFAPALGAAFFAAGAAALAVHYLAEARGLALAVNDSIALRMFACVSYLAGGAFLLLGSRQSPAASGH